MRVRTDEPTAPVDLVSVAHRQTGAEDVANRVHRPATEGHEHLAGKRSGARRAAFPGPLAAQRSGGRTALYRPAVRPRVRAARAVRGSRRTPRGPAAGRGAFDLV